MAQPTSHLEWTDGDPSKVVEPSAGKKLAGWQALEKPPAEFFNWLFYTTDLWNKYLNEQVEAFKAVGTFFDAVVGVGGTHADFATLMADPDVATFKHILVNGPITMTSTVVLNQDDMTFWFKPQAGVFDGGAGTGLQISGNRVRLQNGRFGNFTVAAIEILAAGKNAMISNNFFFGNTADIVDNGCLLYTSPSPRD